MSKCQPRRPALPRGRGRAGAVIAVDWGAPSAPRRPRPHVATVKASDIKVVKFRHVAELAEKIPAPAVAFVEAAGPYLEMCRLRDIYAEVCCVDTRLVAQRRRANGVAKSDENDAKILLEVAQDYLAGRLTSGVWRFVPDELKRAVRECERAFRCYQKIQSIWPEKAQQLKEEYKAKVRKVEELAREDGDCQELVETLSGFGSTGLSVPTAITELRGKRFHSVKALYRYARENRRLRKAVSALAEMVWRTRRRSEKAKKIVEGLRRQTKNNLKRYILVRAARAAGAL